MKIVRRLSVITAALLIVSLLNIPARAAGGAFSAAPVRYDFYVDGESKPLLGYEIGGGVWFKLRDLAMAVNGTGKQFEVSWDGTKNAVSITSGTAYTPVGGELAQPDDTPNAAYLPETAFYLDGSMIPMRSYVVNGAHYVSFSDLAANIRFSPALDEEERFAKINTETYDTGLYALFFLPEGWLAGGSADSLSFTRSGEPVGSLTVRVYDPGEPISQLMDNHRETLSSENLSGFSYPAAKALIRATQPAAAGDDSYVDELHLYLMPEGCGCAFDFCFDSAQVNEQTATEIAKNFRPDEAYIRLNTLACQWARAVRDRDGLAQYELLTAEMQTEFKGCYEALNWVTGVSSPWVNSWTVEVSGNRAVVFYQNETSTGFAGYTTDVLSFSEENGELKISGIDGFNDFSGYSTSSQESVTLPEGGILLASLPDEGISLYGDKSDYDSFGGYDGLYLSIKGVSRYYEWRSIGKESFLPALSFTDINGDNRKELIVILTTGEGTGVDQKVIHVIDPEDFMETGVTDPLDIVGENVGTSIVHKDGAVTITVTAGGNQSVITLNENYAQGWAGDKAIFGNIVTFETEGGKLTAKVPVQVSYTVFVGEIDITYAFDGTGFVLDTLSFVPYDFQ